MSNNSFDCDFEVWREIPGWEGYYSVSSNGRVLSMERKCKTKFGERTVPQKILSQVKWSLCGHVGVRLKKTGLKKHYKTHQLVAMAFMGHDPSKSNLIVDHVNNIPYDNRLLNLQLITIRDNTAKSAKVPGKTTSKYTGVSWDKKSNKWKSQAVLNGKKYHLGFHDSEVLAYIAYVNLVYGEQK